MKSNLNKEFLSIIILLLINLCGTTFLYFSIKYWDSILITQQTKWMLGIYAFSNIILGIINLKLKSNFLGTVLKITVFPFAFLVSVISLVSPIIIIQAHLFSYLLISFLTPLIVYRIDNHYLFFELNLESWLYLILSSGSNNIDSI